MADETTTSVSVGTMVYLRPRANFGIDERGNWQTTTVGGDGVVVGLAEEPSTCYVKFFGDANVYPCPCQELKVGRS